MSQNHCRIRISSMCCVIISPLNQVLVLFSTRDLCLKTKTLTLSLETKTET